MKKIETETTKQVRETDKHRERERERETERYRGDTVLFVTLNHEFPHEIRPQISSELSQKCIML